ncbi:MAG: prefoldin subunit alpha [Euryarchaeota archaeon]|nr:prefoldin subunit alpha [Euryarchaeota archaeon]
MTEAPSEEEIKQLLQAKQQYQAEAEAIVRQLGLIQLSTEGCEKALSTINAMGSAKEGQEMLVSIGEGSFIRARIESKDKVILGVGAGVSIEKTTSEAEEELTARKAQLVEGANKLNETLMKIDQGMAKVQSVLSEYERGSAAGSEMVVQ